MRTARAWWYNCVTVGGYFLLVAPAVTYAAWWMLNKLPPDWMCIKWLGVAVVAVWAFFSNPWMFYAWGNGGQVRRHWIETGKQMEWQRREP